MPGLRLSVLVEAFQKESGVRIAFEGKADLDRVEPAAAGEIRQLVREALHNVHKHAGATEVTLSVRDADGAIEIAIDDNGGGFPFHGSYTLEELDALGKGPVSIRRRVRKLDGAMKLESLEGHGAKLRIRIPQ